MDAVDDDAAEHDADDETEERSEGGTVLNCDDWGISVVTIMANRTRKEPRMKGGPGTMDAASLTDGNDDEGCECRMPLLLLLMEAGLKNR